MRKIKLLIEARREGYSTSQCERGTITAGDLRELLEGYDDETEIFISNDNGYTYGSIHEYDIREEDEEEEDE